MMFTDFQVNEFEKYLRCHDCSNVTIILRSKPLKANKVIVNKIGLVFHECFKRKESTI